MYLLGLQKFDVFYKLKEAAVLAVGLQMYAEVALAFDRVRVLLVLICPTRGNPANHLTGQKPTLSSKNRSTYRSESK